jgi:hypothetical protein
MCSFFYAEEEISLAGSILRNACILTLGGVNQGQNYDVNIGAAQEACSATQNLGTNSAFALGTRKPTQIIQMML